MWIKGTTTLETNTFVLDEWAKNLQLTEEEYKILFIQPVCAIFPEALKMGEWKLILDREIDNEGLRSFQKGQEDTMRRKNFTWTEEVLQDGTKVYYPTYGGRIKRFNI